MAKQLMGPNIPPTQAETLGKTATHAAITSAVHDTLAGTRQDATPYNGSVRRQWDPELRQPVGTVHPPHKAAPTNLRTGLPVQRGPVRNILGTKLPGADLSVPHYELTGNSAPTASDVAELKAIQRVAGLNPERLVNSESVDRYQGQQLPQDASPFAINGAVELQTCGRPMMPQNWSFPDTEVADRFKWPLCLDVDRLPWLKNLE